MVSIMPGMLITAPERTETRRGLVLPPNFLPVVSSGPFHVPQLAPIAGGIFPPCL